MKSKSALFTLIHVPDLVVNDLLLLVIPKENKMFAFIIFQPNAITCSASETTFAMPSLKNYILVAILPFSHKGSFLMSVCGGSAWLEICKCNFIEILQEHGLALVKSKWIWEWTCVSGAKLCPTPAMTVCEVPPKCRGDRQKDRTIDGQVEL